MIHIVDLYPCYKICEKTFAQKSSCTNHIRTHDEQFKMRCSICNSTFATSNRLKVHQDRYHNIVPENNVPKRTKWDAQKVNIDPKDVTSNDVNDYVINVGCTVLMELNRNANGYFECPEDNCDYKSLS